MIPTPEAMSDEKQPSEEPVDEPTAAPAQGWSSWSLEKKLSIVVVPVLVAVIGAGVPLLTNALGDDAPSEPNPSSSPAPTPEQGDVARFSGVVGNFENARAFLTFLEDNNGEPVQLDEVGFNEATFDDIMGDPGEVTYVQVWTECNPDIADDVDPDFGMGCTATSFEVEGAATQDTQTYLQHGVPVYDGYFRVDVSGNLQNGVSPIYLQPLTRVQATSG